MLTTTRSYWTATRIFYAVVAGLWLTFTVALLVALLHGSGVSHRVLMPVLVSGGVLLLGLTILAANLPRPGPPPDGQVHRRPARVGGRPFGEGAGAATRRAPVVENRVVDHVYISRTDLKETTARMAVVPSGHLPAVGVAPVAVVERETSATDGAPAEAPTAGDDYLAGFVGAPGSNPEDPAMRDWVAGAVDGERARPEDDPE